MGKLIILVLGANAAAEMTSVVGLAEKWNQYCCDEHYHLWTLKLKDISEAVSIDPRCHTSSIQP